MTDTDRMEIVLFILKKLNSATEGGYAYENRNQAFGAMMYYNQVNGYDEELSNWWNNQMVDKFDDLIRKQKKANRNVI